MLNCFMDYVLTCKDVTNVKADVSMNTTSPSTCWLLHLKLEDKKKPQHTAYIYVCVRAEVHSKIHSQLIYKNKVVSCFTWDSSYNANRPASTWHLYYLLQDGSKRHLYSSVRVFVTNTRGPSWLRLCFPGENAKYRWVCCDYAPLCSRKSRWHTSLSCKLQHPLNPSQFTKTMDQWCVLLF